MIPLLLSSFPAQLIFAVRMAPPCSVVCWTSATKDRVKMTSHIMRLLLFTLFVLLPRAYPATTTTSATPINTCCPPGHFLAIEDLQQSKQGPDGDWQRLNLPDSFHQPWTPDIALNEDLHRALRPRYEDLKNAPRKAAFTESFLAREWYDLIGNQGRNRWDQKLERHQYISRVFCVPDKNDLPSIDGLSGASLPSPPYYATTEGWRHSISIESRVLAEGQVLQSKGSRLPSCPGGPAELASIVLGNGQSSGTTWRKGYSTPLLRINEAGLLVGRDLDVISLSNLRIGKPVAAGPGAEEPPLGNETELDVDFCLTWNTDPRTKLSPREPYPEPEFGPREPYPEKRQGEDWEEYRTRTDAWEQVSRERGRKKEAYFEARGPLSLLQAVYCDPCKAKVFCSLLTKAPWYFLQDFLNPDLLHGGENKPVWVYQLHPVVMSYLDSDEDGKVSIREFYDLKIVHLLKMIFDGLDANNDGTVDMSEASLTSLFRPAFFKSVTEELFDFADVNNDNMISMEDLPPIELFEPFRHHCLNSGTPLSHCLTQLNKTEEICQKFGRFEKGPGPFAGYHETHHSLKCKALMSIYLPLVDRNGDDTLSLEEVQQPFLHLFQFLVGKPGQSLGVDELASGFEKLREPPIISNTLKQLLTPILDTIPRIILQSLVSTADKNGDKMMDFNEFEGFGDFEFIYLKWESLAGTTRNALRSSTVCWREGETCFPSDNYNTKMLLRYFSDSNVLFRLINNLFYHKDFQFPTWNLEE